MSPPENQLASGVAAPAPLVTLPREASRAPLQYLLEGRGWTLLHVTSDLVAAFGAVLLAIAAGSAAEPAPAPLFLFPFVLVASLYARGLYRRRLRLAFLDAAGPLLGAVSVAAMTLLTLVVLVNQDAAAATAIGQTWALTIVLLGGSRLILGIAQRRARAARIVGRPTLIIGAGVVGEQVARRLDEHPEYGLRPIGLVDDAPLEGAARNGHHAPVLGALGDLRAIVARTNAEHVILAFTGAADRGLIPFVRGCTELGLEVSVVPRLFESVNDRMVLERLGALPLHGLRVLDPKGWQFRVKYAMDRPLAALMLLVVAPIMLVTALAVKLTSPGPVLFRQRRVGRDGRMFDVIKFRSMLVNQPDEDFHLPEGLAPGGIEGEDRRTPIGRFLRRSAIDELPQLVNVLKGEMSLVGPRPERPEYVEMFNREDERYADRHRVKSGITGWAQVNGLRGQTSLSDRVEWDNYYISNWSLWLDLKVLLMTVGAVLRSGDEA